MLEKSKKVDTNLVSTPGLNTPGLKVGGEERLVMVGLVESGLFGQELIRVVQRVKSRDKLLKEEEGGDRQATLVVAGKSKMELLEMGILEKRVKKVMKRFEDWKIEREQQGIDRLGVRVVCVFDDEYPESLREIDSPPALLFVRGGAILKQKKVAIVGTRMPSEYGKKMADQIAFELSRSGVVVISGLAYGVDGMAHKGAVRAKGITIGVLGQGIDEVQPAVNRSLAEKMIFLGGCVVSEYPPGYPAMKQNFPARNRIIAGLSDMVVVVEGRAKSGSRITAEFGKEQGKVVGAVPGRVGDFLAETPNQIIHDGGVLVRNVSDVAEVLGVKLGKKVKLEFGNEKQRLIYQSLEEKDRGVDELARDLNMSSGEVLVELSMMEIEGLIKMTGNLKYRRLG